MAQQILYFTQADLIKLGEVAETARSFLHQKPTRGEYDNWMNIFLSIEPMIEVAENGVPASMKYNRSTFVEAYREQGKMYDKNTITANTVTIP